MYELPFYYVWKLIHYLLLEKWYSIISYKRYEKFYILIGTSVMILINLQYHKGLINLPDVLPQPRPRLLQDSFWCYQSVCRQNDNCWKFLMILSFICWCVFANKLLCFLLFMVSVDLISFRLRIFPHHCCCFSK